ncbi:MAG: DUF6069 family protein [Chloroflexota bacterium]
MSTSSNLEADKSRWAFGSIMISALIAGVIAAIANVVVLLGGGALIGGVNVMPPGAAEPEALPVVVMGAVSFVGLLIGGVGLWVSANYIPRGVLVWQVVAVVLTLLSLGSVFSGQVETTGGMVILTITHLLLGAIMVWYLTLRE